MTDIFLTLFFAGIFLYLFWLLKRIRRKADVINKANEEFNLRNMGQYRADPKLPDDIQASINKKLMKEIESMKEAERVKNEDWTDPSLVNFDKDIIKKIRMTAYQTIRILEQIEKGERDPKIIAMRTKADILTVAYYLKLVGKTE